MSSIAIVIMDVNCSSKQGQLQEKKKKHVSSCNCIMSGKKGIDLASITSCMIDTGI